jgi:hypothetical protein
MTAQSPIPCPCCGQPATVPAWQAALERLTPTQCRVARVVAVRRGLSARELAAIVYEHDPDGGPETAERVIAQMVSRANKRIADFGFRIAPPKGARGYIIHRMEAAQ